MKDTMALKLFLLLFLFSLHAKMEIYCDNCSDKKRYDLIAVGKIAAKTYFKERAPEGSLEESPLHFEFSGESLNMLKALSQLGKKCALYGTVGKDALGQKAYFTLQDLGIFPFLKRIEPPTKKILSFLSSQEEEKESSTFSEEIEIERQDLAGAKHLHIESTFLLHKSWILSLCRKAKEHHLKISLDLRGYDRSKEDIIDLLANYIDLLFLTEKEAKVLTKMEPLHATSYFASLCPTVVILSEDNGGWVKQGKDFLYFPKIEAKIVDFSGKEEYFLAGFIYGYLKGKKIEDAIWTGLYLASQIIKVIGSELPLNIWESIKERIYLEESMAKQLKEEKDLPCLPNNPLHNYR